MAAGLHVLRRARKASRHRTARSQVFFGYLSVFKLHSSQHKGDCTAEFLSLLPGQYLKINQKSKKNLPQPGIEPLVTSKGGHPITTALPRHIPFVFVYRYYFSETFHSVRSRFLRNLSFSTIIGTKYLR
jgi:hypothetical protein